MNMGHLIFDDGEIWRDISAAFAILDEHLVYIDAPIEGFLRALSTGELFAFRCNELVKGALWFWTLLPVASTKGTVQEVFSLACSTPAPRWLSIVEDRRGAENRLSPAWLSGAIPALHG